MKSIRFSFASRCLPLLLLLLLAACGTSPATDSKAAAGHPKPSLEVKLDVEGDRVTVTVETDMSISPEHYNMARKDGEGHIHLYLDNQSKIVLKEPSMSFSGLKPGKHAIKVSLHNNDHTPYDVTKTTEFEIR